MQRHTSPGARHSAGGGPAPSIASSRRRARSTWNLSTMSQRVEGLQAEVRKMMTCTQLRPVPGVALWLHDGLSQGAEPVERPPLAAVCDTGGGRRCRACRRRTRPRCCRWSPHPWCTASWSRSSTGTRSPLPKRSRENAYRPLAGATSGNPPRASPALMERWSSEFTAPAHRLPPLPGEAGKDGRSTGRHSRKRLTIVSI